MVSPPMQSQVLRILRSFTAPDAWVAVLLVSYLQYKQYTRRKGNAKGKIHAGAKSRPKSDAPWSFADECLLTSLRMMVSPLSSQASGLNADMVDLKSEEELNSYASKVASGKAPPKKKKPKSGSGGGDGNEGKTMEVRSRRIVRGEMVYNAYYPLVETTVNLALSMIVGLASRWLLALIRSLKLSSASSISMSPSGPGGHCCSPYRGGDDEGTRLPGSFERLLACVLIKQEGDYAGTFMFTLLLLAFTVCLVNMAWSVSAHSLSKKDDLDEKSQPDDESGKSKKNEGGAATYTRIHPRKVRRFIVGAGATLASLMLFHTPALLRMLGLDGLTEAVEELSARILLFGNLLGCVSLPAMDTLNELPAPLHNLMNGLFIILALMWGYVASVMMSPIEETARNAAHVLSPSPSNNGKNKTNPNEMFDLINARMILVIQAMAPFMIMCTFLFSARFAETMRIPARGDGQMQKSFSKKHLQNSGLFIRAVLSWLFVGASCYTFRTLLQSFLDQAATVASAMATLGEGVASGNSANAGRGSHNKRAAASASTPPPPRSDPFNERYNSLVMTAGRIAAFPAFVLAMLAIAHLRGGDGSTHPGIGYESQPKDAPRSIMPVRGLLPPYSEHYMSRISLGKEVRSGDVLLHKAALSQSSWDTAPYRDSAHKKVVNWFGKNKFCYPPEGRSVKALGRHVNYLLDTDGGDTEQGSILTLNPLTGRELLDVAPPLPLTLVDALFGRMPTVNSPEGGSCKDVNDEGNDSPDNSQGSEECKASQDDAPIFDYPNFSEMLSFVASHSFFTPTVVFPIIDTFCFLSSLWWNYWYSIMTIVCWIKLRRAAFLQIAA